MRRSTNWCVVREPGEKTAAGGAGNTAGEARTGVEMGGPHEGLSERRAGRGTATVVSIALVASVWAVYASAADFGLLPYDDPYYITECPMVVRGLEGDSIRAAWTTPYFNNYHPLTTLSWAAEVEFFGPDPRIFHRTNIGLHAANAVLLFLALRSLTGATWRPAVAAALFAVHPLNVQPVCWVSSRKDVLSFFFAMWAILAYGVWARRRSWWAYGATFAALAASLLSKLTFVTLPGALLLLDFWSLGRWRPWGAAPAAPGGGADKARNATGPPGPQAERSAAPGRFASLAAEKLPLIGLALVLLWVNGRAQFAEGGPVVVGPVAVDAMARIGRSAANYAAYAASFLVPTGLSPMHPATEEHSHAYVAACLAGLAAVTVLALLASRRAPEAVVGWLWYLGMLVPTVGFVPLGHDVRADRYMYAPMVGLLVAGAWLGVRAIRACRVPVPIAAAAVAGVVVLFGIESRSETRTWSDGREVVRKALSVYPDSSKALEQSGKLLMTEGRWDEAVAAYRRAIEASSDSAIPYVGVGTIELFRNRPLEALSVLEQGAKLFPDHHEIRLEMYQALLALGRRREAEELLDRLVAEQPARRQVRTAAGLLELNGRDRPEEAVRHFRAAFVANPFDRQNAKLLAEAHARLGFRLLEAGNAEEALKHFTQVLLLVPDHADAQQGKVAAEERLAKQKLHSP